MSDHHYYCDINSTVKSDGSVKALPGQSFPLLQTTNLLHILNPRHIVMKSRHGGEGCRTQGNMHQYAEDDTPQRRATHHRND